MTMLFHTRSDIGTYGIGPRGRQEPCLSLDGLPRAIIGGSRGLRGEMEGHF
jgi:hypothetical protein